MSATSRTSKRAQAQDLMWEAMEVIADDEQQAASACRRALELYPDCVDALAMLANIETRWLKDFVAAMRSAVDAGRRDLGPKCFKVDKGHFWGLIETRPFMRAMAQLVTALLDWGTPERVEEATTLMEEMLDLNPNDNQGMRDWLGACYVAQRRYDDAEALLLRYPDDWLAAPAWTRVLLVFATDGKERATELLVEARKRNRHVEKYLTGAKRLPRARAGGYSPGDENEAVYCADMLRPVCKAHPKAKNWLKGMSEADGAGESRPRLH